MTNKQDITPIFYDDSSGRGILNWEEEKNVKETGPQSILKLCKDNNLTKCVFISSTFYSYITAWELCKKNNIQLIFGLELPMCPDRHDHSEESIKQDHRVIVFLKNSAAYSDACKLYSAYRADKEARLKKFRYDKIRCDDEILNKYWTDNFLLALPFFDNFAAQNMLVHGASIIPKFPTDKLLIMREIDTEHPHEKFINLALDNFNKEGKYDEMDVKSVFYEKEEDMKAWMVYRGILKRASFQKPEMDYCCSSAFNFEKYKELVDRDIPPKR